MTVTASSASFKSVGLAVFGTSTGESSLSSLSKAQRYKPSAAKTAKPAFSTLPIEKVGESSTAIVEAGWLVLV
ncbi:hypothetical protein D3C80_99020 [compost metagenome]